MTCRRPLGFLPCCHDLLAVGFLFLAVSFANPAMAQTAGKVRVATYNIAFHERGHGELARRLAGGKWQKGIAIASVIQTIRPDILLLNEFDYDETGAALESFRKEYLEVGHDGREPIEYPHVFTAPVNTGIDSGFDLNEDRQKGTPNDAFGYGEHPGQFGMVVLSRFPIDEENVRTFQKFLWKDMPGALLPIDVASGQPYYSPKVQEVFRLSSKSHWDVPVQVGPGVLHFLVCHPTPPVFDGPEDRNGRRNHDEIRFFVDYVSGKGDYIYDDQGQRGGLESGEKFVIAGDLNADPLDGDSYPGAVTQLLECQTVHGELAPRSTGGAWWAEQQGGANLQHKGDPACDTGDFPDRNVGNLRVDYVMPSRNLKVAGSAVVWPKPDEPLGDVVKATDHRMVWVDLDWDQ